MQALFLFCWLVWQGAAQPQPAATPLPREPIKGRVIIEDGTTMSNITVTAVPIGGGANRANGAGRGGQQFGGTFAQTTTDEEGNFIISSLAPASYSLMASAPGYVTVPPDENTGANVYHPGEVVTLTLVKGGVITGKVYGQTGDPLTGINVSAQRIGGINGETDNLPQPLGFRQQWRTDDQGVYRIYGLTSGIYVVQSGGRNNAFGPRTPGNDQFSDDAPTFYPSAVRDGATPVTVYAGAEASGIDIRYRHLRGFAVSGKVLANKSLSLENTAQIAARNLAPQMAITIVTLNLPGTDTVVATSAQMPGGLGPVPRGGQRAGTEGFAFYAVPEGDYDLVAIQNSEESDAASMPKRIIVRGADVSGLEITLLPLASISGRLKFEKLNSTSGPSSRSANEAACKLPRSAYLTETLLRAVSETNQPNPVQPNTRPRHVAPDAQGAFFLRGLRAGQYRLAAELPAPTWYVRSLQFEKPVATATVRKPATAAALTPANPARDGLTLKQGERTTGLIVTLAEGAATLIGTARAYQLVHLIPSEPAAADDLLRYSQSYQQKDGAFRFTHLAPGKYWLLTQTAKPVERPLVWDATQRANLRRTAESTGRLIELSPCQTLNLNQSK